MKFQKRFLEEAGWGSKLLSGGLGALGATALMTHTDAGNDLMNTWHELDNKDLLWNHFMNKGQQGLEWMKTSPAETTEHVTRIEGPTTTTNFSEFEAAKQYLQAQAAERAAAEAANAARAADASNMVKDVNATVVPQQTIPTAAEAAPGSVASRWGDRGARESTATPVNIMTSDENQPNTVLQGETRTVYSNAYQPNPPEAQHVSGNTYVRETAPQPAPAPQPVAQEAGTQQTGNGFTNRWNTQQTGVAQQANPEVVNQPQMQQATAPNPTYGAQSTPPEPQVGYNPPPQPTQPEHEAKTITQPQHTQAQAENFPQGESRNHSEQLSRWSANSQNSGKPELDKLKAAAGLHNEVPSQQSNNAGNTSNNAFNKDGTIGDGEKVKIPKNPYYTQHNYDEDETQGQGTQSGHKPTSTIDQQNARYHQGNGLDRGYSMF